MTKSFVGGCEALEKAMSQISTVLDVLDKACVKVNISKSEVLMLLRGKRADEARRRFGCVRGGEDHLRIPCAGSSAYFAIKSQIRYLGVVLSYGAFETQTAIFRCGQAKAAFGQLRSVLRAGSCLTKADRLRVYRLCVWSVLEYGLIGVGLDKRALDSVRSTVAGQLRKVFRIYGKGITNRQVFQQSDIDPEKLLLSRMDNKLATMPEHNVDILQAVRARLCGVQGNLQSIIEAGDSSLTPHVEASAVSCPVCGLYFANEMGLNMHIKSSHPQVHDDSRVQFVKARHAVNGIPQCFFCLKMLCDHHSLEKQITMGGCSVIKAAISNGQTLESLEAEIAQQHSAAPPQVPEPVLELNQEEILLKDKHPMYFASRSQIPLLSDSVCKIGSRCILCGQILLDKARIKTHWRKAHPTAWRLASSEALRVCGRLKSIFRKPCQFCKSPAKNSNLHATQCSTLFQVCAGQILQAFDHTDAAEADVKLPQVRSSAVTPACKQVDMHASPLATAFRAGATASASVPDPDFACPDKSSASRKPSDTRIKSTASSTTTLAKPSSSAGTVRQTSILRFAATAGQPAGRNEPRIADARQPWLLQLRLQNAHQLCYVNSSATAMLHILCLVQSTDLRSLVALCKQAATAGTALALHSQLVVRSLAPRWQFNAEQKDASEFLMQYIQVSAATWSRWESRRIEDGAPRITDYGGRMLFTEMLSEDHVTLSALLSRWSQGHSISGVAEERSALVVQLGRYVQGRKNTTLVDFEHVVEVPTFVEGVEQRQKLYMVQAAIVHKGQMPTSGHYRSLLRLGQMWGFSDDGVPAQIVRLDEHHQRNAYVLLLVPIAQA